MILQDINRAQRRSQAKAAARRRAQQRYRDKIQRIADDYNRAHPDGQLLTPEAIIALGEQSRQRTQALRDKAAAQQRERDAAGKARQVAQQAEIRATRAHVPTLVWLPALLAAPVAAFMLIGALALATSGSPDGTVFFTVLSVAVRLAGGSLRHGPSWYPRSTNSHKPEDQSLI